MKDESTGNVSATDGKTDWARLRAMSDAEIQAGIDKDSDIMPTDAAFWEKAAIVMPRAKQTITIRLDADVLDWFKRESGYQTRINAILQAYMKAHSKRVET